MVNAKDPFYNRAEFIEAAHQLRQLPHDVGYEVAFAGRSNAGKSTALNAITSRKSLARTSKTPGRTQQIVVFQLDEDRRLCDLPGYGYAKVPPSMRKHWDETLGLYFQTRESLKGLVLIMDIRHPLKESDWQILRWCESAKLPCHILLTKSDKLKRSQIKQTLFKVANEISGLDLEASIQDFSGASGDGVAEAHEVLNGWLGRT